MSIRCVTMRQKKIISIMIAVIIISLLNYPTILVKSEETSYSGTISLKWQKKIQKYGTKCSRSVLLDNKLYISSEERALHVYDLKGNNIWNSQESNNYIVIQI